MLKGIDSVITPIILLITKIIFMDSSVFVEFGKKSLFIFHFKWIFSKQNGQLSNGISTFGVFVGQGNYGDVFIGQRDVG